MNIIKRDGSKREFDSTKIRNAIMKAMEYGSGIVKPDIAESISSEIKLKYSNKNNVSIYDIEKDVFNLLIDHNQNETARAYEGYRSVRAFQRQDSSIVDETMKMMAGNSEYWNGENSNKNAQEIKVQRDYMAGILSTDITRRKLLPPNIVQAHDEGIIHFHDMDYFAENAKNNCSGFNLEDMLQNGTVMNGKAIHKPHSLLTASNVATQLITAVSSSQYGGVTISLTHLAPFVRISEENIRNKYIKRNLTKEQVEQFTKEDLKKEIRDSVQLFNYQINTMFTVNGQAPFLSVFMYIGETDEYKKELAMLIEEFLNQRLAGMENQANIKVTQEFPKLLYVLEEDNITEDSPYWYLTVLAAKCSAKRLTPDYISAKKMKEYKNGDVYWCMGCVDGESVIDYKLNGIRYVESFETAWNRLSGEYEVKIQDNGRDEYIDTDGVEIFDNVKNAYVKQYRIIRNTQSDWYKVKFSNGRTVDVTNDHPFEIINKGMVHAEDLVPGDETYRLVTKNTVKAVKLDSKAWLDGVLICDSSYAKSVDIYLGRDEDDIKTRACETLSNVYGLDTTTRILERGVKGSYIDLYIKKGSQIHKQSVSNFKGIRKIDRQIPDYIFNGTDEQKMSFMAGMIDADGYINNTNGTIHVQIGSTNKKLATQQMMLAIDIGLNASMYNNHYVCSDNSDKIRYRVEFNCPKELASLLASKKKADHFDDNHKFCNNTKINSDICAVSSIDAYYETKYSYDVTTESEHFMFDGIYSHNCRSFLTPDRFTDAGIGNIAKAKNYVPGQHKYYGRLTNVA